MPVSKVLGPEPGSGYGRGRSAIGSDLCLVKRSACGTETGHGCAYQREDLVLKFRNVAKSAFPLALKIQYQNEQSGASDITATFRNVLNNNINRHDFFNDFILFTDILLQSEKISWSIYVHGWEGNLHNEKENIGYSGFFIYFGMARKWLRLL